MTDPIRQPAHYRADSGIEAIDVIRAWRSSFSVGNALKYLCRAGLKPGQDARQDLQKALWYVAEEVGGKGLANEVAAIAARWGHASGKQPRPETPLAAETTDGASPIWAVGVPPLQESHSTPPVPTLPRPSSPSTPSTPRPVVSVSSIDTALWMSAREACEVLGINAPLLRKYTSTGRLPAFTVRTPTGRALWVDRAAVASFRPLTPQEAGRRTHAAMERSKSEYRAANPHMVDAKEAAQILGLRHPQSAREKLLAAGRNPAGEVSATFFWERDVVEALAAAADRRKPASTPPSPPPAQVAPPSLPPVRVAAAQANPVSPRDEVASPATVSPKAEPPAPVPPSPPMGHAPVPVAPGGAGHRMRVQTDIEAANGAAMERVIRAGRMTGRAFNLCRVPGDGGRNDYLALGMSQPFPPGAIPITRMIPRANGTWDEVPINRSGMEAHGTLTPRPKSEERGAP